MKLTLHTFLSVDGVMQGPGGVNEDRSGGFALGGWLVPYADQAMGEIVESWMQQADAFLLGGNTYALMQAYWSQVTDPDNLVATSLNTLPKHVASTTLRAPTWAHTTVLKGDVLAQVRRLKREPGGELQVHGSALLAQTLHEAGLVDEYRLLVFPVCLGTGKRLFLDGGGPSHGFQLVDHRVTETGAVYSALTPTPLRTGELSVEDGREHAEST